MITTHETSPLHSPNQRYILHEKLGQGGMGVVYRATDRLNGKEVALKQVYLPPEQLDFMSVMSRSASMTTQNLRLALAQEFQTLATLRHPHIISVLDYGFGQDGQPYFTMNLLEEAQTILEAGQTVDVAGKMELIEQMLQALAYLHRRGILHRDVKPSNVLVSEGKVRVLDFGLSTAKEEANHSSGGTFAYLAPELLLGEYSASESSDLYAVGVIAYELLVGRHPFEQNSEQFLDQVLNQAPDLSALEAPLAEVIGTLLKKQPQARYRSAEASLAALSQALGQPTPAESVAIRESYLQAATFVGREHEMATLTKARQEAQAGHGSAWLIGGESGVGKSRLLRELQTEALVNGFQLLRGECIPDGGGSPYHLWRDPLQQLIITFYNLDDLTAGVLLPLVPNMAQLLGREVKPAPQLEGEAAQSRLFTTIANLFLQAKRPLLLILEDLHWASESLRLIPYLTRLIDQQQLMLVGSYRNDERPDLSLSLPEMSLIELERLTKANIAVLSAAMLGEVGQEASLLEQLQAETEGNAFFLVEIIRFLAEDAGGLNRIEQGQLKEGTIPQGIQAIVERHWQRLPLDAQPLLLLAAIAGRQLDLSLLAQLTQSKALTSWLSTCADTSILTIEDNQWQFSHDKIRKGIINRFSQDERMEGHRKIAEAISVVYPDDPTQATTLAFHWHQAGDAVKELDNLFIAGRYAAEQFANKDAIRFFSRAYKLIPESDLSLQCACLQEREKLYNLLGMRQQQDEDLLQLQDLANKMNDPAIKIGVSLRRVDYHINIGEYQNALDIVPILVDNAKEIDYTNQMIEGWLLWSEALVRMGNYVAAEEQAQKAFALGETINNPQQQILILEKLGVANWMQTDLHAATALIQKALALAEQHHDIQNQGVLLGLLGTMSLESSFGQSMDYLKRALEISEKTGDHSNKRRLLSNLGFSMRIVGKFEQAKRYLLESLVIAQIGGDSRGEAYCYSNLGQIAFFENKLDEVDAYLDQALHLVNQIGEKRLKGIVTYWRARALEARESNKEAKVLYQHSIQLFQETEVFNEVYGQAGLLRIAIKMGEPFNEPLRQVLHFLNLHESDPLGDLFVVHLSACHALYSLEDPQASIILAKSYHLLMEIGQSINDSAMQQAFLENYPAHREVLQLYEALESEVINTSLKKKPQERHESADACLTAVEIGQSGSAKSAIAPPEAEENIIDKITMPDLERLLTDILAQAIQQVGAERGVIVLRQKDGEERIIKSIQYGEYTISRTIIKQVIQRNKGLLIRNAMTDRNFARARSIMKGRIRSVLCVPLREKEQAIGAIYLEHRSKRGKFSQQDLSSLERFGKEVAEAMG